MESFSFICPVCGQPLGREENTFRCKTGHSFDRARSGYVNLLLSGGKHAKIPGDNKQMVLSRRAFLEKGFYRPMADALCRETAEELNGLSSPAVLDAGCGEGYYPALLY